MRRVAIYARETTGRVGRARLDRQVGQLAAQVARQPDWNHVATYADQWTSVPGNVRDWAICWPTLRPVSTS
jgi:hypothetical protein